jgi:hypothetical protein
VPGIAEEDLHTAGCQQLEQRHPGAPSSLHRPGGHAAG